ncbi:ArsR/SmtB family transcription factor [Mangrovicoccus algicola]|uniref:Helix-turn-helix transcriptional regulator n=1 Tax=Mangrovicoccus algicola TaxID=2771008 RepID=A0A8J6YUF9_9RHOB|nr:metalloregulator ArsR/SmtB family transcription factor [Mangrovicoccus algicola]MBE3637807.1 helix-turn-helix transcriptional regulator [Mangrovicoccus algicola]
MTYIPALQALADPTRRALLDRLRLGPASAGRLAQGFRVSRPAVSQHLRVLVCAGLLDVSACGARRIYRLRPEGLEALRGYLDALCHDARMGTPPDAPPSA